MSDTALLFYYVAITVWAFFVAAPIFLSAISLFGVQKRFAKEMIAEGVITEDDMKMFHGKKEIAGVIISIVVIGALIFTCHKTGSVGYVCGILSFTGGFLKYRHLIGFNSVTVQRFRNTYKNCLDTKKLDKYVREHF